MGCYKFEEVNAKYHLNQNYYEAREHGVNSLSGS